MLRTLTYLLMAGSAVGLFWVGVGKLGVVSFVIAAGACLWLLILRLAKAESRYGDDPVVGIPEARIVPPQD